MKRKITIMRKKRYLYRFLVKLLYKFLYKFLYKLFTVRNTWTILSYVDATGCVMLAKKIYNRTINNLRSRNKSSLSLLKKKFYNKNNIMTSFIKLTNLVKGAIQLVFLWIIIPYIILLVSKYDGSISECNSIFNFRAHKIIIRFIPFRYYYYSLNLWNEFLKYLTSELDDSINSFILGLSFVFIIIMIRNDLWLKTKKKNKN